MIFLTYPASATFIYRETDGGFVIGWRLKLPYLPQEGAGCSAGLGFEYPVKVGRVVESGLMARVENVACLAKTLAGVLDSPPIQIGDKRLACYFLEKLGEAALGESALRRDVGNPTGFIGMNVDGFNGPCN